MILHRFCAMYARSSWLGLVCWCVMWKSSGCQHISSNTSNRQVPVQSLNLAKEFKSLWNLKFARLWTRLWPALNWELLPTLAIIQPDYHMGKYGDFPKFVFTQNPPPKEYFKIIIPWGQSDKWQVTFEKTAALLTPIWKSRYYSDYMMFSLSHIWCSGHNSHCIQHSGLARVFLGLWAEFELTELN